jgi:diphthamide biosynthesis methyltransferase
MRPTMPSYTLPNVDLYQESYYGRSITVADREMVESNSDEILRNAQNEDVAFLVVGDPFGYELQP